MPRVFVENLISVEMHGLLGHELAHIRYQLDNPNELDPFPGTPAYLAREMKVDNIAARWVGANVVAWGLQAVARTFKTLMTPEEFAAVEGEINPRVAALR